MGSHRVPRDGLSWIRCKIHGATDDTIRVHRKGESATYVCRRCEAKPCDIHGTDYATVRFDRNGGRESFCISCDPRMLEALADERRP